MAKIRGQLKRLGERRGRLVVSDEARARAGAAVLWLVVLAAVFGGLGAWFRRVEPPATVTGDHGEALEQAWAAAGFGERFVAAYLAAGPDDDGSLAGFLGYSPDLPATDPAGSGSTPGPAEAVGVEAVADDYWAVTVAVGQAGIEQFWRVGVQGRDGHLVASALPTPVAGPSVGERVDLAVEVAEAPPADEPSAQALAGFVLAYLCGQGELSRYLAPGVALDPVPALCREAEIVRWGTGANDTDGLRVVAEVVLDPGPTARLVGLAVDLARRDGRWEVAELLPAPPLADDGDGPPNREVVP